MKKIFILTTLGVGVVLALIFTLGGHAAVQATSEEKFCNSCHSWMDPMAQAYNADVHSGANANGARAKCADCHLPHDSLVSYLTKKGANGITELAIMTFKSPENMDWQKNRENRESFVYDSGCLSCHSKVLANEFQSPQAKTMHEKYDLYKNAKENPLSCVSCHKHVGHKGLGKILYNLKNEPIGEWPEDNKNNAVGK